MRRIVLNTLAVCATLALAAPALAQDDGTNNNGDEDVDKTVTVEATEFKFKPDEVKVSAGTTVKLELVNKGNVAHSFEIPKLDVVSDKILPGKSTAVTFTAKKGSDYQFICNVPGHKAAGMKGTLEVTSK